MARIEANTFKNWTDGETLRADDFDQIIEILRTGINANYDDIIIIKDATVGTITGVRAGTAFPETPVPKAGDLFLRTDYGVLYHHDGTQWTSKQTQQDSIPLVLQSSWVNYQLGMEGLYYKDDFARVHLSGRFKDGASTDSALLATLPVEYRPAKDQFFRSRNCDVLVSSDGSIRLYNVTNTGDIGIDGLSFRV